MRELIDKFIPVEALAVISLSGRFIRQLNISKGQGRKMKGFGGSFFLLGGGIERQRG